MDIKKLEKWVNEHPEEADLPAMNITSERVFTVRDVLEEIKIAGWKRCE